MDMSALYSVIVVQCGIAPDYFLDRMQWYEVDACLKGLELSERTGWEQTRCLCYVTAQVQSSKKLNPLDMLSFEWDRERKGDTGISDVEIARLKKKAEKIVNSN
jgi:hypothetical protein